ncbi:MAG: hypothetical protein GX349_07645 [Firmicutes bacterium]|nr:hypothetical protein [Bacillota bacterium]
MENIIERIVVTTLESQVTAAHLPTELQLGKGKNSRVVVNGIIPLKVATQSVEEQLVLRAMEKYKNTYKAAEALGVNQSTVVRKMQKYSRGGEA